MAGWICLNSCRSSVNSRAAAGVDLGFQRRPLSFCNWANTVYHGLPKDLYKFNAEPGKYLAFLGRVSPEKCPDQAIELAKRVGLAFEDGRQSRPG